MKQKKGKKKEENHRKKISSQVGDGERKKMLDMNDKDLGLVTREKSHRRCSKYQENRSRI